MFPGEMDSHKGAEPREIGSRTDTILDISKMPQEKFAFASLNIFQVFELEFGQI